MKRTAFLTALLVGILGLYSHQSLASHYAGAEISYEYIGGTTGVNNQYKITLKIYRDISGIAVSLNQSICIKSSCFAQTTQQLTFDPVSAANGGNNRQALPVPNLTECVNLNDPNLVMTEIYFFSTTVTLNGTCADWTFSWHDNARNTNNITNLTFGASGSDLYVEAMLNNVLGPNTSPAFVTPAAKAFCVGQPFVWSQAATEPDGDNVSYAFGNPQVSTFTPTCLTPSDATFAPGYSVNAPMTTANGIQIDQATGTFRFTPTQIENVVLNVRVEETRYDPTFQTWIVVGSSMRDMQVPIVGNCNNIVADGPKIDVTAPGFSVDPIAGENIKGVGFIKVSNDSTLDPVTNQPIYDIPIIPYQCYDNTVNITFDVSVLCESISPDGTDFRLIGPDNIPRPVVGVIDNCQLDLSTTSIDLVLHKPLDVNGDYYLQIKKGTDGNTLTNACGFELNEFFTMAIRVLDCPVLDYSLQNVTVVNDKDIQIDWEAVSGSFSTALFDSWNILRANNDNNFYPLASVEDVNARTFVDQSLSNYDVDNQVYQYRVQLVQNADYKAPTNQIRSILLSDDLTANNGVLKLDWTEYDGWTDPAYELFLGKKDPVNLTVAWNSEVSASQNFLNHDYTIPAATASTAGIYAVKVEATDVLNASNPFISESNWIFFEIFYEPTTTPNDGVTYIPNIMTPNGDDLNDRFYISSSEGNAYTSIQIAVYNRWGQLVFEDDAFDKSNTAVKGWDGTDMNSGQKLADGTYYYIITAKETPFSKAETFNGSLSILGGTY